MDSMLKINSVISETYDLLKPSDYMRQEADTFYFKRPSPYAPLRELRIRSFKPIVKKSIRDAERLHGLVTIKPVIIGWDGTTASTVYKPEAVLYNEKNGVRLPVSSATYRILFTGYIPQFVKDINDAVSGYCEEFDMTGTFAFGSSDSLDYLQKDSQTVTINEWYNSFKPTRLVTPTKQFVGLNDDLTVFNLSFNIGGKYALTFVVDINIDPLDIFYTSTFIQTFNVVENLPNWYLGRNDCINQSVNFSDNITKAQYIHYGKTLTLGSPFERNLSQKIYVDFTEASVTFKVVETSPSANEFQFIIIDKNNEQISTKYLNLIYDQIIVEVDYVFGSD